MDWFSVIVLVLILITSSGLLVSRDWRKQMIFLALQYLAMFFLLRSHWPLTMSAAKLITGWMSVAILGITRVQTDEPSSTDASWPEGRAFRLLSSSLVALAVLATYTSLKTVLPGITPAAALGGMLLVGLGLLQLGITIQPLRVIVGLLTVLCGFEILYSSIENSILVAAMLTAVNLGLAMLGAYLLISGSEGEKL